ncbi:hypothetical protein C8R47DRAFT_1103050 [Mycena vitilis]|nr:hypothetical protein C8R47DRAFT_1103050 [Mycena vitilis]
MLSIFSLSGSGLALLPLLPVYAIIRAISPWLAGHVKDPVHFILFGPWMLPMALLCWLLGEKFPGEPVNY